MAWRFVRYFAYRIGLGECPTFLDVYPEAVTVFDRLMKWPVRLRVEGTEHCPRVGPAVFSGNHFAKEDPFIMYRAVHSVCNGSYPFRYMMRDDFFKGLSGIMKSRLLDVDELARLVGSLQISRDRVQLTQLKPFISLLREHGAFIMYPGRSRSRTGVFIEYRDGIDEPGGVTFLIAQAQRNRPDLKVPAVPMARTQNLVTKKSVIIFGEPIYLPHDADRAAQRALDFRLIELMGDLVEINVAHVVAGIVYLHALHGCSKPIQIETLGRAVENALARMPDRRIDPAARTRRSAELDATLTYFEHCEMLTRDSGGVLPNGTAVLAAPPHDTTYGKQNPVKYIVNQILHLPDVTAAIEEQALRIIARQV